MIHASFPAWLRIVSSLSIASAVACAVLIVVGEINRPQKMWIMNLVWPLSALFGSLFWLIAYFAWGRRRIGRDPHQKSPFPVAVLKASSHCGAGCTLGDLIAEWLAFAFPTIAVWFGWRSLFAEKTFAVW